MFSWALMCASSSSSSTYNVYLSFPKLSMKITTITPTSWNNNHFKLTLSLPFRSNSKGVGFSPISAFWFFINVKVGKFVHHRFNCVVSIQLTMVIGSLSTTLLIYISSQPGQYKLQNRKLQTNSKRKGSQNIQQLLMKCHQGFRWTMLCNHHEIQSILYWNYVCIFLTFLGWRRGTCRSPPIDCMYLLLCHLKIRNTCVRQPNGRSWFILYTLLDCFSFRGWDSPSDLMNTEGINWSCMIFLIYIHLWTWSLQMPRIEGIVQ